MKLNNIRKIIENDKEDFFSWMLFRYCNYNCSYCLEKQLPVDKKSIEELKITSNKIYEIFNKKPFECFSILGGELSLLKLKDFMYIFDNFKNLKNIKLEYITNFSADNKYYLELINFFNIREFILKCSLHTEFITIEDFFKKILKFIFLIRKNNLKNVRIKIEYVLTQNNCKNIDKIIYWFNKIKYEKIDLCFQEAYEPHYIDKKNTYNWGNNYLYLLNRDIKTEFLNQKMLYTIEYLDGKKENVRLSDNFFNLKNKECLTNNIFLENNILFSNCCQRVLTNDFLNSNINDLDLDFKYFKNCKRKYCCRIFKEIRVVEK